MPYFLIPPPGRQVYIQDFLAQARSSVLQGVVLAAVREIDPSTLSSEMQQFAPASGLMRLQGTVVRDELVFATPSVLRTQPSSLGYYRLLLGVSQKQFYTTVGGLQQFRSMEERNFISPTSDALIPDLCTEMNAAMATLLSLIPAGSLQQDVDQLPLLTLGAQADGSWRNVIGSTATKRVFDALKSVVDAIGVQYEDLGTAMRLVNSAGRTVTLTLAPDPDIEIREDIDGQPFLKVAVEIKGGMDYSNVHNRAGEAEKSHQKASARGATDFWTIIATARTSISVLRRESPTTRQWFDLGQVLAGDGPDWTGLVNNLRIALGI